MVQKRAVVKYLLDRARNLCDEDILDNELYNHYNFAKKERLPTFFHKCSLKCYKINKNNK